LTRNGFELDPVPFGVVTVIGPVVAPAGTVAVICVSESSVQLVAAVSLNLTEVAPVKLLPLMVTTVPTGPITGEKDEIVGAGVTVKLDALVAGPPPVVTPIGPVVAPEGTVVVICVSESTV